jgi:hypothetical protein
MNVGGAVGQVQFRRLWQARVALRLRRRCHVHAANFPSFPDGLVGPLKIHANINLSSAHGNLTRAIFKAIPVIDEATASRLRRQARLFVELYDNFYTGIWRYYTSDGPLLRRVSQL